MREEIVTAAAGLFRQHSIKSTTMDEIARRVGISKKTLYAWCTDKDELVEEVYLQPMYAAAEQCMEVPERASDAVEEAFLCWNIVRPVLHDVSDAVLHDLQKYHHDLFIQYELFRKEFLLNLMNRNIERGQREKLYRSNISPEIIACYQLSAIENGYTGFVTANPKWSSQRIEEQLVWQYLNGLATAEGAQRIADCAEQFTQLQEI
ncbi:MAG: TetR/AcrR family transcriptional regulator [Chitinophagaceae bacterium]|nr:TetR/AcrR family transcriptional regulator [Chitinophagaceae bacterium]